MGIDGLYGRLHDNMERLLVGSPDLPTCSVRRGRDDAIVLLFVSHLYHPGMVHIHSHRSTLVHLHVAEAIEE